MERKKHDDYLKSQIMEIESRHINIFDACKEIIPVCRKYLLTLRDRVASEGFQDESEEIYFFKFTKQIPMINLIYYSEVQDFETYFPMNSPKEQKRLIKEKSRELNQFFRMHSELVKYVRLEQTHFDKQFFTRNCADFHSGQTKPFYILDPVFNTSHDYLLAKIKAFQRISLYFQNRCKNNEKTIRMDNLRWTSTKVSLTELVYALYHSGAVNNGKADIKQIANAFEKVFNFSLGDFYRTYIEIRSRKKDRMKFLDEINYIMSRKMEQGDA
ncbi:RteC domain-containing protein [Flagellimonas onchidii]|uniref:RteC domain-containing protein n=1 Tax=Flagellimonas onchidii TaxID=2562684 RepID=UPI0010A622C1|nr:RteC domain-containing protein [Allomuricauda onchidii]